MEKKKLTFMPDGNNTYAGFYGDEIVALITPLDPKAIFGPDYPQHHITTLKPLHSPG